MTDQLAEARQRRALIAVVARVAPLVWRAIVLEAEILDRQAKLAAIKADADRIMREALGVTDGSGSSGWSSTEAAASFAAPGQDPG